MTCMRLVLQFPIQDFIQGYSLRAGSTPKNISMTTATNVNAVMSCLQNNFISFLMLPLGRITPILVFVASGMLKFGTVIPIFSIPEYTDVLLKPSTDSQIY